ncbi:thiolase family protein [Staphylococcus simulans]|uniref:thiolase family protein n=1 Tax=Staphylococcus simulans TaxID=1286 RepID=UPI001E59E453|nr:thiolase family protein [Staphylococcus simulans]MCD8915963.1 thiolase family protein [Staphylococcus simulans]
MREAVIIEAKRTPIGQYGGLFKHLEPEDLLQPLIKHMTQLHPAIAENINDVIIGNTVGNGGNIARKSLLHAGLSYHIPGMTVDRQCGSGLEAVNIACRMVQAGAGDIYLAGGVESVSRAPWKIQKPQSLYEKHPPEIYERAPFTPETMRDPSMLEAAENVAQVYQVSRERQDAWAARSHHQYFAYQSQIQQEIIPLTVHGKAITQDESAKQKMTVQRLSRLKPLFKDGTITVGNACPKSDGAALVLVMSREKAEALGLKPLLKFTDAQTAGVNPKLLGIGPVPATEQLLMRRNLSVADIDWTAFNEAFSSQVLASIDLLGLDEQKVNPFGGALAEGHPYGASGANLVARLLSIQAYSPGNQLLAAIGIGGGLGIATLFKKAED